MALLLPSHRAFPALTTRCSLPVRGGCTGVDMGEEERSFSMHYWRKDCPSNWTLPKMRRRGLSPLECFQHDVLIYGFGRTAKASTMSFCVSSVCADTVQYIGERSY